jgi:hypothetical protein
MNLFLTPHPDLPPRAVRSVNVQVGRESAGLQLLYVVEGDPALVRLPVPQKPSRADGLWESTCLELFLGGQGSSYREFNFSPSGQWAAYAFQTYRGERKSLALKEAPVVRLLAPEPDCLMLLASIVVELGPDVRFGPTAVIEETDGTKSYWALRHPPGEPDFHHPDCFALELPPLV